MDNIEQLIMPSRKGWSATVGYDHLTGEPTDIEVNEGYMANSPFADNGWTPNEVQVEPEALGPGQESEGDQMIIDGLIELYPQLDNMLDFAVEQHGEEFVSLYDDAVDSGDWNTVMKFLEQWSQEFAEANPQPEAFSHEQINEGLNDLADMAPEGLEMAFSYLQMAEQTQDPIESDVLQSTAAFHRGEITAEQGIQAMLDRYPIEKLIPIYQKHNL